MSRIDSEASLAPGRQYTVAETAESEKAVIADLNSRSSALGAVEAARIRIMDKTSLSPVSAAIVYAIDAGNNEHRLSVSDEGSCILPSVGIWYLQITADSYCRRDFANYFGCGEQVILLERAGAVEVEVRSSSGKPMEGEEVLLLPPVSQGRPFGSDWRFWAIAEDGGSKRDRIRRAASANDRGRPHQIGALDPQEAIPDVAIGGDRRIPGLVSEALDPNQWTFKTDRNGRARWSGLPPCKGYRVGWLGVGTVEVDPRHEHVELSYENGRWSATGREIDDLTAELDVRAGTTTHVLISPNRGTGVSGWIDADGCELRSPSLVTLFHRSTRTAPGAPDLRMNEMEAAVVPSKAGQFEFLDVKPGAKRLAAHWSTSFEQVRFATYNFNVMPGEVLDIGFLHAQQGYERTLRITLVDSNGRDLEPSRVFASGEPLEVALCVDTETEPKGLPGSLSQIIGVHLGSTPVLTGLPPGRVHLRARIGSEYELIDSPGLLLVEPKDRWINSPGEGVEDLAFVASWTLEQRLRVAVDESLVLPRLELHWRSLDVSVTGDVDLPAPRRPSNAFDYSLRLAQGTYQILLHAGSLEAPSSDEGWYWTGQVDVRAGAGVLHVHLKRGAALSGLVLDSHGTPIVDRPVLFAPRGWSMGTLPSWTHKTRTDDQGRYHMSSFPPGEEVLVSIGMSTVRAGASGTETTANLHHSR
jgi:hypothetical protein